MNKELNVFTLRMLRDQYQAEHLDTEAEALEAAIVALEQPQQVTGKLNSDCISRQAAIDAMATWDWQELYLPIHFKQLLEEIPSAQPEQSLYKDRYLELLEYFHGDDAILKDRKEFSAWLERMCWHVKACGRLARQIEELKSAQPEPLTDKEQRIFLAAMGREEKVCAEVDRNYVREPYEDSLMRVCREIKRKVKGALWT